MHADTPENVRRKAALIRKTANPRAPEIFEAAYNSIDQLALLLVPTVVDKGKVREVTETMLSALPKDNAELNRLAATPEYIIAMAAMFREALVSYGRAL